MTGRSTIWEDLGRRFGDLRPGGTELTRRALEACGLPGGSRILDIGCGAGATLEFLKRTAEHRVVGLDPSGELLAKAAARCGSAALVQGGADTLPFGDGSFDALFCECVLSVVGERAKALGEFARVLRPGGFLAVSDLYACGGAEPGTEGAPQHGCLEDVPDRAQAMLTREDLQVSLSAHGFTLLLWEDHKRALREFAARLILAGQPLDALSCCQPGKGGAAAGGSSTSYFLLVARKG